MRFGTNHKKYVATYVVTSNHGEFIHGDKCEIIAEADSFNELLFQEGVLGYVVGSFQSGSRIDPAEVQKTIDSDFGQCFLASYTINNQMHAIVIDRNLSLGE